MEPDLKNVAVAADAVADDQRRVARQAGAMQRRHEGWSWGGNPGPQGSPNIIELLRRNGRRLAEATSLLTEAPARGLGAEGQSGRQMGRGLGVTHQRVTAPFTRSGRR